MSTLALELCVSGGTCWLALLGNSFAFVRDVDRAALPVAVRAVVVGGRKVYDGEYGVPIATNDVRRADDGRLWRLRMRGTGGEGERERCRTWRREEAPKQGMGKETRRGVIRTDDARRRVGRGGRE